MKPINARQLACLLTIADIIDKTGHCSIYAVDRRSANALERRGFIRCCMEHYGRTNRFWREVWTLTTAGAARVTAAR